VVSPFVAGTLDIRWDDPAFLAGNTAFEVVGTNIYRSDVSDRGPYHRINDVPVGGTFYRDRTEHAFVSRELVQWDTAWISKGDAPNDRRWVLKTQQNCVKQATNVAGNLKPTFANSPSDVILHIDGVEVPVDSVFGATGEITLINQHALNEATEKFVAPGIPTEDTVVEVSYWTNRNHVRSGLDSQIFYRLATVVLDAASPTGYRETSLGYCPPVSLMQVESLDYIWREAVRRNEWILYQGGERVKVFIRKLSGVRCFCKQNPRHIVNNKQPSNRCASCYGTGFLGGYEGPYDLIIAPDDYERRISQGPGGRRKEHTGETWTGPSPVLTQRDFIVKQTNERYSIGPVRRPTNRGNHLQQHFSVAYLDEQDIRYRVPIDGTTDFPWPETRYSLTNVPQRPVTNALPPEPDYPVTKSHVTPMETQKDNVPDDKQQRGRTAVWENTNY
jgi:hypothetical protein